MTAYTNLRARYSRGVLKLTQRLDLPENAEVQITVTSVADSALANREAQFRQSAVALPPGTLSKLDGIVSLGGDALVDGEALYDSD
jgi:predicted DNA-binding antitoxin AbrB/MazE fold protein